MKSTMFKLLFACALLSSLAGITSAYFSTSDNISENSLSTDIWNPGVPTISEIYYNPPGTDAGKEWIDITNTGGYSLDMTGYVLHFDTVGANHFIFPSFSLPGNGKVRIHVHTNGTQSQTDLYWPNTGGKNMSNTTGSVALFKTMPKNVSNIVDFVAYGTINQDHEASAVSAGIWADDTVIPVVTESHSVKLINNFDHNLISDWEENDNPV